jgi:hypothetical protein
LRSRSCRLDIGEGYLRNEDCTRNRIPCIQLCLTDPYLTSSAILPFIASDRSQNLINRSRTVDEPANYVVVSVSFPAEFLQPTLRAALYLNRSYLGQSHSTATIVARGGSSSYCHQRPDVAVTHVQCVRQGSRLVFHNSRT